MKICILVMVCFASLFSYADVTITEESSGSVFKTYYSKGIMAHYIDGQLTNITDVEKENIYVLNPMRKTYFQASFAKMKEFTNKLNNMPENSMLETTKVKVAVNKLGTKTIAGYSCEEYQFIIDELYLEASACFSKDVYTLIKNELDASKAEKLMNELDMADSFHPMGAKIAEMEYTEGYILKQDSSDSIPGFGTLVTSVSKAKLDKSVFAIPPDYKKIPMQEAVGTY
ncbi:MAG: hypothetical protein C0602_01815 [Denitrovibrio sp.]|nr:MAG: hypothetical protein C0602_01815 [Denitrovibrio sp.]